MKRKESNQRFLRRRFYFSRRVILSFALIACFTLETSLSLASIQVSTRSKKHGVQRKRIRQRVTGKRAGTEMYRKSEVVSGEVLVKVDSLKAGRSMGASLMQLFGTDAVVEQVGGPDSLWFSIRSGGAVQSLISKARAIPGVVHIEPNFIIKPDVEPNDEEFTKRNLWGLQNLGQCYGSRCGKCYADVSAVGAWDTSRGNKGVVIGVLDSGIDYDHPDLKDNLWEAPESFLIEIGGKKMTCDVGSHGFNAIKNSCSTKQLGDSMGHGTLVSGVIGAKGNNHIGIVGVNWDVSIMALKVMDGTKNSSVKSVINALDFVIQAKKQLGARLNLQVLNNSYELNIKENSPGSQALQEWIKLTSTNGLLFVAAAGNDAVNTDKIPHYPSSYKESNIISVAATNSRDQLWKHSNYGRNTVHLAAPGSYILSTIKEHKYEIASGTSLSAPFVSGAAALLLSSCARLTMPDLKRVLLDNVDPLDSLSGRTVSGGRLNINRAIKACSQ